MVTGLSFFGYYTHEFCFKMQWKKFKFWKQLVLDVHASPILGIAASQEISVTEYVTDIQSRKTFIGLRCQSLSKNLKMESSTSSSHFTLGFHKVGFCDRRNEKCIYSSRCFATEPFCTMYSSSWFTWRAETGVIKVYQLFSCRKNLHSSLVLRWFILINTNQLR